MKTALLVCVALVGGAAWAGPRDRALEIAEAGLLSNIAAIADDSGREHRFVLAGGHQFHTLWTRDFAMASAGVLAMGQGQAVKDSLDTIFANQRADGLMPRLIDHENNIIRIMFATIGVRLPFEFPLHINFVSENGILTIDGNALLPWAASHYIEVTGDRDAAQRWWPVAVRSLEFLEREYWDSGLIGKQPPFADWEDSVARKGRVAFTNEAYLLALRGLSGWARFLGMDSSADDYARRAGEFQKRFHDFFWIPGRNMIRNFEGDDHLTADANLMAVAHGLVSPDEAAAIMETLRASPLWKPMPGRVTWPDFANHDKDIFVRIFGLPDYHDSLYWLWLSSLAAEAERAVGEAGACETILDQVSGLVVSKDSLQEIYKLQKDRVRLKPVRRFFYRAEVPFTWSSGMFVHAVLQGCRQGVRRPTR
jgi:glycogen debranching enzyme